MLKELAEATTNITELKMEVAQLKGTLELKEQMLKQETLTKAAQVELAASKAKLEAHHNLAAQISEAYNNGLKFAQNAFAMFAPSMPLHGPPSSGHRSTASRMSHSSGEEF